MIVIPMAGLSRRFRDAGYERPKYMLDLDGRTLFAHAVDSFRAYFTTEPFLFIARDEQDTSAFMAAELAALDIARARTVILPGPTLGQADTVRLGLAAAAMDGATPLTIFNIDTFRPGFHYPEQPWMAHADGYLEVMTGSDPSYSYVLPVAGDQTGRVAATAEKTVISDLASTGLYWFRRASDFLDAFQDADPGSAAERYIAPLYNSLIRRGLDVRYERVAGDDVIFCGTPEQYHGLLGS